MSKTLDPIADIPDLTGKVAVVTGGNSGIGFTTVKFLALRGAKVYFTARSEEKAKHVYTSLVDGQLQIQREQLIWLQMELGDLETVNAAVAELKRRESMIDILINNAGLITNTTETAGDGWEMHMAVCHVGHFVFTNGLLPLLKAATKRADADVRIVTVSSAGVNSLPANYSFHFDSPTFLADPVSYYPWTWRYMLRFFFQGDLVRYTLSKIANVMFAQELQRILDEQGVPILSISVHPGSVATEGSRKMGSLVSILSKLVFISADNGSRTSLFAATAKEVRESAAKFAGKFLVPYGTIGAPPKVVDDRAQARGLWENTTAEVQKYLTKIGQPPLLDW